MTAFAPFAQMDLKKTDAWPFVEAQRIVDHLKRKENKKGYVLFETGYGPSGLPHIGTFGEVARTIMVKQAFERISDIPTRLIAFSDDMDGLRKVPGNVPNKEMMAQHLHKPLTQVPDPFGKFASFAHHNNQMLRDFLDSFGFEYEFFSATEQYKSGALNEGLLAVLRNYDAVLNIVLPTLGEERQQTYSPFLPVCPESGHVLQVPVVETNPEKGTLVYKRDDGKLVETSVLDGHCKLQWKADWAMRWYALDVDYEMAGKDLIDSVRLSTKIVKAVGGQPPVNLVYEHFVDDQGRKISKSVGNGITIDQWLSYATPETLSLFMYRKPQTTKKLFAEVIPKTVDEYFTLLDAYHAETDELKRVENPVWHIHNGNVPQNGMPVTYNMLLNLVSTAAQNATSELVWGFLQRYRPELNAQDYPILAKMVAGSVNYYKDFVLPHKNYRQPNAEECKALMALRDMLRELKGTETPEDIQTAIYSIGKEFYSKEQLKEWFAMLYQTLFGLDQGPRMGSFVAIFGRDDTIALIDRAIEGKLSGHAA